MPRHRKHEQRWATWVVVAAMACGAIFCLYRASQEYRLSTANQASTCTVLETTRKSTEGSGNTGYSYLSVQFEHFVAGKRYTGEHTLRVRSEELTRYTYRDYAPGRQITCLYVAGRPDLVALELKGASDWGPLAGFGAALIAAIGATLLHGRRRKR